LHFELIFIEALSAVKCPDIISLLTPNVKLPSLLMRSFPVVKVIYSPVLGFSVAWAITGTCKSIMKQRITVIILLNFILGNSFHKTQL